MHLVSRLDYFSAQSSIIASNKILQALLKNPDVKEYLARREDLAMQKKLYETTLAEINNPNLLIKEHGSTIYGFMAECKCTSVYTRESREKIEKKIIQHAIQRFPIESYQNKPLRILSLGSGELLQIFILIMRLLEAGYREIDIFLVDTHLPSSEKQLDFSKLIDIVHELGGEININYYIKIDSFIAKNPQQVIDIVSCIDYEDIFKSAKNEFADMLRTHQQLSNDGFMFFSYEHKQMILDKTHMLEGVISETLQEEFNSCLYSANNLGSLKTDTAKIALISEELPFEEWIFFLPKLRGQMTCEKMSVTLLHPKERDYFGHLSGKNNPNFNEENLSYFLSLCIGCPCDVNIIPSRNHLIEEGKRGLINFDVITFFGSMFNDVDTAYKNIDALETTFPNAIKFYFVELATNFHLPLQIARGTSASILEKSEFIKQLQHKMHLHRKLEKISTKLDELLEGSPKHLEECCRKVAVKIRTSLQREQNITLEKILKIAFLEKVDGETLSLIEMLAPSQMPLSSGDTSFWTTQNYKKMIVDFVKNKFNVDLEQLDLSADGEESGENNTAVENSLTANSCGTFTPALN